MIRAGVGISTQPHPRAAAREAARAALEGAGVADAALLFAGPGVGDDVPLLLDAAVEELGTEVVVGATAHGVLATGHHVEEQTATVILALSGVTAVPFLVGDAGSGELEACEEIAARLEGGPREEDLLIALPDPRNLDAAAFLEGLRRALGPAVVVGAGAGDPLGEAPLQWAGREVASGGIAGLVLRSQRRPRVGVTQACRPATELLTVTRSRGHWILELDGRPALDLYREVARGPLAEDLQRAAAFLLAALPVDPAAECLEPGSYLVRNVIGFEPDANAFAIPEPVEPGRRIALAVREPEAAREDLKAMLERLAQPRPAFGLFFDCCARGTAFFGVPGLASAYLERAFGPVPLAGMYGSCELGPIGGRTELLTYTGVLALVDG